jgi:hypothetical protein
MSLLVRAIVIRFIPFRYLINMFFDAAVIIVAVVPFCLSDTRCSLHRFLLLGFLLVISRLVFFVPYILILTSSQYEYYARLALSLAQSCFGSAIALTVHYIMCRPCFLHTCRLTDSIDGENLSVEARFMNNFTRLTVDIANTNNKERPYTYSTNMEPSEIDNLPVTRINISKLNDGEIEVHALVPQIYNTGVICRDRNAEQSFTMVISLNIEPNSERTGREISIVVYKNRNLRPINVVQMTSYTPLIPNITIRFTKNGNNFSASASISSYHSPDVNFSLSDDNLPPDDKNNLTGSRPRKLWRQFARLGQGMKPSGSGSTPMKWKRY